MPLVLSGVLIVLFSIEHIIALLARRGGRARHGTDHPRRHVLRLPDPRRAGRLRHRPVGDLHHPLRGPAGRGPLPADDVGDEHLLVPRHPVLRLQRRADAARRHRRQDRRGRAKHGRPHPRRARHVERRRLHAVRRRRGLAGRRRLGDGRGDDPDDEAGGLPRRLRGQRDDPRRARRRPDADQPQHDHLCARGGRQGVDRLADPGGHAAGGGADGLHAGGGLLRRGQARLSGPGTFPGWDAMWRSIAAAVPGLLVIVIILVRHPLRRLHGDRGGVGRGDLLDPAHLLPLPHDDAGSTS